MNMQQNTGDDSPLIDLGSLAAEPPASSVREELNATTPAPEGDLPPDTGGIVSPDHAQAAPAPDTKGAGPRDHPPVAPD